MSLSFAEKGLKIAKNLEEFSLFSKNSSEFPLKLSYAYYEAEETAEVKSGAYIFRPSAENLDEKQENSQILAKPVKAYCYDGEIVKEIHVIY